MQAQEVTEAGPEGPHQPGRSLRTGDENGSLENSEFAFVLP